MVRSDESINDADATKANRKHGKDADDQGKKVIANECKHE